MQSPLLVFFHRVTYINTEAILFNYNQQVATLYNILYYCQCSTCFKRFLRPSSGAQNCTHSIAYMSNLLAATANGSSTIFFITFNALHVSGGFSAHHQEPKTVYTASRICQTCKFDIYAMLCVQF